MKKKSFLLLAFILTMTVLYGCGSKISNDIISISKYKGLDVERPENEDITEDVSGFEDNVWKALLTQCAVKEYPQEERNALMEELETQYSYAAYYSERTASELIEDIHGMTKEELAKELLKKKYAVELIAEEEDLVLTQEQYQEKLAESAAANGMEDPAEYENLFGYEELSARFLEERVLDFLIEHLK